MLPVGRAGSAGPLSPSSPPRSAPIPGQGMSQGCEADSGCRAGAALVTFRTPEPGGIRDAQKHVPLWGLQGDQQQVRSLAQRVLKVLESRQPEGPSLRHLLPVVSKVTSLAPDALHEGLHTPRHRGRGAAGAAAGS